MNLRFSPGSKFNNRTTDCGRHLHDSQREAGRCRELCLMERAGEITGLGWQVPFDLEVNGYKVCKYVADFLYTDGKTGERLVEDTKGFKTPVYRLKKKLMKACLGIEVLES
jgi:uncharacterized protein DUF1064